ncbi:hypothetical protein RFI_24864, partial [Reticulomyxa filosa]
EAYEARQNILAVGFYEYQRARDEQSSFPSKSTTYIKAVPSGKDRNKIRKNLFDIDMEKDYYPQVDLDKPLTDINSVRKHGQSVSSNSTTPGESGDKEKQTNADVIFATNVSKFETVSITEICVLYNTPCGCPAESLQIKKNTFSEDVTNTNNGQTDGGNVNVSSECKFVVDDIVRYQGQVFTIGGFGPLGKGYKHQTDSKTANTDNNNASANSNTNTDTNSNSNSSSNDNANTDTSSTSVTNTNINSNTNSNTNSNSNSNSSENATSSSNTSATTNSNKLETVSDTTASIIAGGIVKTPIIYINEVGGNRNLDVSGADLNKVISRLVLHCRYPRMMIADLPNHLPKEELQKRLKSLFFKNGVSNVVRFDPVMNDNTNMFVSFKSKADRESALEKLKGAEMNNYVLAFVKADDSEANDIGCDEPMHEHMYYCNVCSIGLLHKYALRTHIKSTSHVSEISKKSRLKLTEIESKLPLNKCILCDESVNGDWKSHLLSPKHDNNNILMMLSLVRCQVTQQYECQVCRYSINSSYEYFKHCRTPPHQTGLEEAIEPCPSYNRKNVGCNNDRCQFKHVCVACGAAIPRHRCLNCRGQEICNMFNRGQHGCHFPASQCHRKHVCLQCGADHPKAGCPQLGLSHKKFDDSGRDITDTNNPFAPRSTLNKPPQDRSRGPFGSSIERKRTHPERDRENRERERGAVRGRLGGNRIQGTTNNSGGMTFSRGERDRDNTRRPIDYRGRDNNRRSINTGRYDRGDRDRERRSGFGQIEDNNYNRHGPGHWPPQTQRRPPDDFGPPNMSWPHGQQPGHSYPLPHQNWGNQGWRANNQW